MTPDALAALHALCFTVPRPWSAAEFADLLMQPGVTLHHAPGGAALGRIIGDEAELLTLAVAPSVRRRGIARRLLEALHDGAAHAGATSIFLEVSAANSAARGLYADLGYVEVGCRSGYYRDRAGPRYDALVLRRPLS